MRSLPSQLVDTHGLVTRPQSIASYSQSQPLANYISPIKVCRHLARGAILEGAKGIVCQKGPHRFGPGGDMEGKVLRTSLRDAGRSLVREPSRCPGHVAEESWWTLRSIRSDQTFALKAATS